MADVVDTNPGYFEKVGSEVAKFQRMGIFIGFQGSAVSVLGEDASVVDIATFNEFGTVNVPERPFLRASMDENREKYVRMVTKALRDIMDGKATALSAAERIGIVAQADVQKKIRSLETPPNAQVTIDRKGSSSPLIDTGRMLQSVTYTVREDDTNVIAGNAA